MKIFIFVIIIGLNIPCSAQLSEGIDSFEYAEITTEEYCAIFTDSFFLKIRRSVFLENSNHNYDEVLLIALAWNTFGVNSEMLKRKEIDLCDRFFDPAKREIYGAFLEYIDDFWGHDILFFDNGVLCLKQKNKNSIFPFFKLTSSKEDLPYFEPELIESLAKHGGIQKDSLAKICDNLKYVNELFTNFNPPEVYSFEMMEEQKGIAYSQENFNIEYKGKNKDIAYLSETPTFSESQKELMRNLKVGEHLVLTITVNYPNEANYDYLKTVGPLVWKIVE